MTMTDDGSPLDTDTFAAGITMLADRAGRQLSGPVIRELFELTRAELNRHEFVLAVRLHLKRSVFLPSVDELVALVRPAASPTVVAERALTALLALSSRHPDGGYTTDWPAFAAYGFDREAAAAATRTLGGLGAVQETRGTDGSYLAGRWVAHYVAAVVQREQLRAVERLSATLHLSPLMRVQGSAKSVELMAGKVAAEARLASGADVLTREP